ncbi:membrane protein insertion efficiency factor YidD [Limosilactobacillus reuteri]|uniref:membrane protein insertion efficiency factor YidD n=1 Tax=Limosilactobacillus reuteri TaxID=1598 RepID=UPI000A1DB18A|nr:membrane protein insertion efficiency factor YidD [Limosilactobacillus reuteri]MBM6811569.1 membrane protein insertion efficiency factor YidD [Limosilactobacillus reuteri]MQB69384.1 membrane protein insertion efficiency factor YidD [Limosilactobacillus reuteri]MQC04731.1 membrane protein insertion efficiency factor YidD [Limosilactobacillus reuteri]QLL75575.1 membrane protein insertion efficiency factor YidD [Limosilactobacillus reuteri]UFK66005.1 Putative membrane protein insertion efficie
MVRILCDLIRWYQQGISAQRPFRVCRFTPSCSQYMLEALQRFGLKGMLLGSWRLLRCQPFSRGGYDPVPNHFTFRRQG